MRARMKPADILSKDQKSAIRDYAKEQFAKQAKESVRRVFKLLCLSLHEEFGFGKERCTRLIQRINDLAKEHEQDEVYWNHVDSVMQDIGVEFEPENYAEMDR